MTVHDCHRDPDGFCRTCGRFMGDRDHPAARNMDRWDDPETIDESPDDDPESIVWRGEQGRRTRRW